MRDIAAFLPTDKYFQGLGVRDRIVMCQLPLSVTMLLAVILAGILHPGLLQPGPFLNSLGAPSTNETSSRIRCVNL
jgi:hypothetical protein